MAEDVPIADLLNELGFAAPDAERAARSVLEEMGLTRAGKTRISTSKRDRVVTVLREWLIVACTRDTCQTQAARTGRQTVTALRPADCAICGGSVNASAMDRAIEALLQRGWPRLAVVGGSPSVHAELRVLARDRVQLRLIDGTARRRSKDAKADIAWADLVVIWGGTMLDHKVSKLYTDVGSDKVVIVARRGIAALAEQIVACLSARS